MKILVLESPWDSDDLYDSTSVRPFLEGWASLTGESISYRMYHGKDDLLHWIKKFILHKNIRICYIAGHGSGGRLQGLKKGINLDTIATATRIKGPHGNHKKGFLIGSCDVGTGLEKFLNNCGNRISWVAGYSKTIPWLEATLCDLMFLQYMTRGRVITTSTTKFLERRNNFQYEPIKRAEEAVVSIIKDYKMAARCGFRAIDR